MGAHCEPRTQAWVAEQDPDLPTPGTESPNQEAGPAAAASGSSPATAGELASLPAPLAIVAGGSRAQSPRLSASPPESAGTPRLSQSARQRPGEDSATELHRHLAGLSAASDTPPGSPLPASLSFEGPCRPAGPASLPDSQPVEVTATFPPEQRCPRSPEEEVEADDEGDCREPPAGRRGWRSGSAPPTGGWQGAPPPSSWPPPVYGSQQEQYPQRQCPQGQHHDGNHLQYPPDHQPGGNSGPLSPPALAMPAPMPVPAGSMAMSMPSFYPAGPSGFPGAGHHPGAPRSPGGGGWRYYEEELSLPQFAEQYLQQYAEQYARQQRQQYAMQHCGRAPPHPRASSAGGRQPAGGASASASDAGSSGGCSAGRARKGARRPFSDSARSGTPSEAASVAGSRDESVRMAEFRASRGAGWGLEDVRGFLPEFCVDQLGSRFVQGALGGGAAGVPAGLAAAWAEVQPHLPELVRNVFGNYVIQRFMEVGGRDVAADVRTMLQGSVLNLSCHTYGCRVVQKALEVLPQEGQLALCDELMGSALRCARDRHANHVLQRAVQSVRPSDPLRALLEPLAAGAAALASDVFGCRVVQRLLEHCTLGDITQRAAAAVLGEVCSISSDQYGNYVIQHLVASGPDAARATIVARVASALPELACHKHGSNVVESCLKHGNPAQRELLIKHLLAAAAPHGLPGSLAPAMMRDQYGNYVLQRVLEVASPEQKAELVAVLQPHLNVVRQFTYGRHLAVRIGEELAAGRQLGAVAPGGSGGEQLSGEDP